MERTLTIHFFFAFLILFAARLFSQSDNIQNSPQIDAPEHIRALNEQIRIAENNEDWTTYYQLREQLIQSWQQINPQVANLYRNLNDGSADITPDGAPENQPRINQHNQRESILYETPAQSELMWGDDLMIRGGVAYDISMDISRSDEIYLAVLGRLDGSATKDSVYFYKSTDGGLTWALWSTISASTQVFDKIEIMCFDGFPGSSGDSYILIFYLFENGWLRVGRTLTSAPVWSYYTLSGSVSGGFTTDFAVDRNFPSTNYRAICLYDSVNVVKSIRSEPASYGSIWQDVGSLGLVGRDLDLCYGFNGGTYASFNGFNSGNLYVFENPNYADPTQWGSSTTLVSGASDTTRRVEIISSRDAIPNNTVIAIFERQTGTSYDLHSVTKDSGSSTWGSMVNWVIPEENKWPALYSRKTNSNQVFQGVFERSGVGNAVPRSIRYKAYNGNVWSESIDVSDPSSDVTGLQNPEVGELNGGVGVFAFVGANYIGVYFDNSSWVPSDVNEIPGTIPQEFGLEQNYPNPFNPSTLIRFKVPETSFITLKIYDVLGNEISTLLSEEKSAGTYEVTFDSYNLSSGIYFYTLNANNFVSTKKMILVK